MAYLETFRISSDGKQMTITVKPDIGSTLTNARLWTQDNYKSISNYHDLTYLLEDLEISQGTTITLVPSDIGKSIFDDLYFVEFQDDAGTISPCNGCAGPAFGVSVDFARFSFCLLEYLCSIDPQCATCDIELHKALTIKLYIDGLRNSIQLGKFTTAITFWKNLNRACSTQCVECCDLSGIAKKGLGFHTLGGELILY